jgi:sporulation protein YlmC with PRC-barrel domain
MSKSDNSFPAAPKPAGRMLDARLHLLDRQVLDDSGEPVGIVDDLDLDGITNGGASIPRGTAPPRVSGILSGQVLATRIFGGQPPRAKLQPLPWRLVAKIGAVVQLRPTDQSFDGLWLEHWLRDHVIGHIPGSRRAAE